MAAKPMGEELENVTEIMVREAQSGRFQRFAALYERVAPAICAWGSTTIPVSLRHRVTPEDLCQEVWVRAIRQLDAFDSSKGRFRQWVFGFARRVLYEAMRRANRESGPGQASGKAQIFDLAQVPAEVSTASRIAARSEAKDQLLAAIATLDEADARLLRLRGLEGRDHAEVGAEFGTSAAAARKRWQRLRDQMSAWPGVQDLLSEA